ncbi:MAG: DUF4249 domain-containing protein [Bacteroidales bacterium]|nr:DUF4249 domain-containing protein [Bacteroidales bacterium]
MKRLLPIFVFLVTTACVETVHFDVPKHREIVVNCILQDSDIQSLSLYYSMTDSDDKPIPVEEVVSAVLKKNDHIVAEFSQGEDKIWRTKFSPDYGTVYDLEIILPSEQPITASTEFPEPISLSLGNSYEIEETPINRRPPDFYLCFAMGENRGMPFLKKCNAWLRLFIVTDNGTLFAKNLGADHPYAWDSNPSTYSLDSLRKRKLDSERWTYYSQLLAHVSELPFYQDFIRITQPASFSRNLSDEELKTGAFRNNTGFHIASDILLDGYNSYPFCAKIFNLSNEYDRFLCSIYKTSRNNMSDLEYLMGKDNIYSNVQGAKGIFGAFTEVDYTDWR